MDEKEKHDEVQDESVVSMDYTLRVDGEVVDSSEGNQPIEFIQGQQQIIPGLEKELYGMSVGDQKDVVVTPAEGYGDINPTNYAEVPRDEFPPEIPLEPGIALEMTDDKGERMIARIDSIDGDMVRLNFNHPLAGKDLHFNVKIIAIRKATPEELDHGHVHD
jgi:FKBP-type peptidyl-prolyl cis-trans isomerase SlyD